MAAWVQIPHPAPTNPYVLLIMMFQVQEPQLRIRTFSVRVRVEAVVGEEIVAVVEVVVARFLLFFWL
jgi:hypothetical protein